MSTPLLGRRRLENENTQASSHNLTTRGDREDDEFRRNSEEEEEDESDGLLRTDYGSAVYRYPHYLQPGHFTSLEKLMFFTSSILLILLCVFAGLYARSSQQEPALPPSPVPKIPKNHTKKQVRGVSAAIINKKEGFEIDIVCVCVCVSTDLLFRAQLHHYSSSNTAGKESHIYQKEKNASC